MAALGTPRGIENYQCATAYRAELPLPKRAATARGKIQPTWTTRLINLPTLRADYGKGKSFLHALNYGRHDDAPERAMPRLALLVLLPLAHGVRVVTPFRSAPVRMAASVPSVDPALKLVLRGVRFISKPEQLPRRRSEAKDRVSRDV